jgi:hypothetical protein
VASPVIIEVAVNGATPRSANPHVPRTGRDRLVKLYFGEDDLVAFWWL